MKTWLVCKKCGTKEWLQPHTEVAACETCGSARFAENDAGEPILLWSAECDPTSWDVPEGSGSMSVEEFLMWKRSTPS